MKEKFKLYTILSVCFVAFSLVLFVFYYSGTLENHTPANAAVADTYFIETQHNQSIDTPPPIKADTGLIESRKQDTTLPIETSQKTDSSIAKDIPKEIPEKKEVTVYICNSGSAYAYHKDNYCKGLNRCKADINPVTQTQAINWGRRPCKICY